MYVVCFGCHGVINDDHTESVVHHKELDAVLAADAGSVTLRSVFTATICVLEHCVANEFSSVK